VYTLRALGHGRRVYIAFFMKGKFPYGEQKILSNCPTLPSKALGFWNFVTPYVKPEEKEQAKRALEAARKAMLSEEYDVSRPG